MPLVRPGFGGRRRRARISRTGIFSDPSDDGYRTIERVVAGEKLRLPAPFDFTIDTATLR